MRLAKKYLQEIEEEGIKFNEIFLRSTYIILKRKKNITKILCNKFIFDIIEKDRAEFEEGAVARRLREEYLEEKGRLRKTIAINYVGHNEPIMLRCKEHKSSITCICLSSDGNILYSGSKDGSLVKCKFRNFNFK